jgi:hypothetical protein
MDKENVLYMYKGVLVIHNNMGGNTDHCVKLNKPDIERQLPYDLTHVEYKKS